MTVIDHKYLNQTHNKHKYSAILMQQSHNHRQENNSY